MLSITPRLHSHAAIAYALGLLTKHGRLAIGLTIVCCHTLLPPTTCYAGGGPENVFLLVNPTSQDSLAVANHYIALRKIPPKNVFYLPYKANKEGMSSDGFRSKILTPTLAEIGRRKIAGQVDYIIYSCDYPWRIGFGKDFPDFKFPAQFRPIGSLTGLTYLQAFVKAKRKEMISPKANQYFSQPTNGLTISRALRSQYRWAAGGKRAGAEGLPYVISAMLGVTNGRGNTASEIIHSLERAQKADGTKPKGTFYFLKHDGPRSQPRDKFFAATVKELKQLGVAAQIIDGKFPINKASIAGLTTGINYVNIRASGCRFLPGAFCDNFTSYGGYFGFPKNLVDPKTGKKKKFQVTTADFIRHGATVANGTVIEPYNFPQKFPHPSIHIHSVNGCSLGESFYQSVSGPYQQILVGDPLCQPWAHIPTVEVKEIAEGQLLRKQVEMTPTAKGTDRGIKEFTLYVNGVATKQCKPGQKITLDTTTLRDGYHELRIVARDSTPIETQGRLIVGVTVKNGSDAIGLSSMQKNISLANQTFNVKVVSTAREKVEIVANGQVLGSLPNGNGIVNIETEKIGAGPVTLHAVSAKVRSMPLELNIDRR